MDYTLLKEILITVVKIALQSRSLVDICFCEKQSKDLQSELFSVGQLNGWWVSLSQIFKGKGCRCCNTL